MVNFNLMNIRKTYNSTESEIESKKFNIFIGISLGNKFFSKENLRKYIKFSIERTKEKVLILIADKIQAINYNARNKLSMETAINKAIKQGDKIQNILNELINELPNQTKDKIIILRWNDLENNSTRKIFLNKLYVNYNKNGKFQEKISQIVKEYSSKEDRNFSKESLQKMQKYLVEELPEFLRGVKFQEEDFNLYIYPKDNGFFKFVQEIQGKKIDIQLSERLPKQKIAFAVVN